MLCLVTLAEQKGSANRKKDKDLNKIRKLFIYIQLLHFCLVLIAHITQIILSLTIKLSTFIFNITFLMLIYLFINWDLRKIFKINRF